MTLLRLIEIIMAEFPGTMQSELADALAIDDQHIRKLGNRAGIVWRPSARKKSLNVVRGIEAFARREAGGEVEIIPKPDGTYLCVAGKLVDVVAVRYTRKGAAA